MTKNLHLTCSLILVAPGHLLASDCFATQYLWVTIFEVVYSILCLLSS